MEYFYLLLSTIRCSNSCKMDTKIEIKEVDLFSDEIASQNETEFFTKNVTVKTNNDAMTLDNDCDVAIKTDFKSETTFPAFCSQKEAEVFTKHLVNRIKSEAVIYSNNNEIGMKTENEEQSLISDLVLHNEREFLPDDPVMNIKKYNNDLQMDNKVEIKEEPWWLETEASSVCGDIKGSLLKCAAVIFLIYYTLVKVLELCNTK